MVPATPAPASPPEGARPEASELRGRAALERVLEHLTRGESRADGVAMLIVNIDRFRVVNDVLGRRSADVLLSSIFDHLAAKTRPDEVFWLGGDTFAVVGQLSRARADRLVTALDGPEGREIFGFPLVASGGAVDVADGADSDDLMRRADIALHDAKARGGARVEWFDPVRHRDALLQLELRPEILRAVRDRELQMYYQPIVRLADGALAGFEALLRWFHPVRGSLSPGLFMPAIERDGLIGVVGEWVIGEVASRMDELCAHGSSPLVTINLSRLQLLDPLFASRTLARIEAAGIDPSSIGFELTESSVIDESAEVRSQVSQLRGGGALLLIDDFGMGASSLASLHNLPIDLLKIDRAFVRGAVTSDRQAAIARAIVDVGHALGMSVIAEGIETAEEMAAVVRLGCDYGQGYLLGRPAPFADARSLLERAAGPARGHP